MLSLGCTEAGPMPNGGNTTDVQGNTSIEGNLSNGEVTELQQCFSDLGYNGLVFVYSPTCPHCHRMQPIVDDLVSKGLNIQKVNSFEQRAVLADINNNCLTLKPYVPQFICPVNGEVKVGEMSEEELQNFYNSCFPS